ncbi:MAG: exonuclease SbcCD subunit D [Leptospiraceae bacterium]|nr:exonuclease SbcCD subunit D [Leptospiraceae bacterium]MDW7975482.1 exonuclease SbcCD subunit D [Leptospiraceae bacterium]
MKILHTADWHLGKKFHEISLFEVQRELLNQIIEKLNELKPDVFVLAGDIYQHYNPSDEAVNLFDEFLVKAVKSHPGTTFIIINGNHDSSDKLNFGSQLMVENLKIISKLPSTKEPKPLKIPIHKNGFDFDFYVIPFIRIFDFNQQFPDHRVDDHKGVYETLFSSLEIDHGIPILITHAAIDYMGYSEDKTSEDDTYGNVGLVSAEVFKKFKLVLLGHFHKHLKFSDSIYYSGSIYKYSEREVSHTKGILLHEWDGKTFQTKLIPLKPMRDVVYIEDTKSNIINNSKYHQHKDDFVFINIKDTSLSYHERARLKDELSNYFNNIVSITYEELISNLRSWQYNLTYEEVHELSIEQLFSKFLDYVTQTQKEETDATSPKKEPTLEKTSDDDTSLPRDEFIKIIKQYYDEFKKGDLIIGG